MVRRASSDQQRVTRAGQVRQAVHSGMQRQRIWGVVRRWWLRTRRRMARPLVGRCAETAGALLRASAFGACTPAQVLARQVVGQQRLQQHRAAS
jgi:hypothetical protein